jgi:hypothetical protein
LNVRVALSGSLGTTETLDELARIVQAVGDGWHEWLAPDPDETALNLYFEQYRSHRELVQKSYARALLYPLESRRTIVVAEDADVAAPPPARLEEETTLSVAAAAILLTQPLAVLVENEINDGAFFSRLIEIIDHELVELFRESRPPIRFENGGGKTVATSLVGHRADAAGSAGIPLRLLVLADSDSHYPGHNRKDTNELREACREAGASLFVLEKRAIENYVTDPVLSEYAAENADIEPSVAFILSLPSTARDHYPIKKGVPSVEGKVELPEGPEKRIYDGVEFPGEFRPKVSRAANRFVTSTLVHTQADLDHRNCMTEVRAIARWMREEL